MSLNVKAFEQGMQRYWAEIARRSPQIQSQEHAFPQLAVRFASRNPQHFTRADMVEILTWKHTDARWRDRALEGLQYVTDDRIRSLTSGISIDVAAMGRRFRGAISGVGVASVSAILTAARPDLYAVIDVFALIAIDRNYTFPWLDRVPRDKQGKFQPDYDSYAPYVDFCRLRAAELTKASGKTWTPRDVDIALWGIGKQLSDGQHVSCH